MALFLAAPFFPDASIYSFARCRKHALNILDHIADNACIGENVRFRLELQADAVFAYLTNYALDALAIPKLDGENFGDFDRLVGLYLESIGGKISNTNIDAFIAPTRSCSLIHRRIAIFVAVIGLARGFARHFNVGQARFWLLRTAVLLRERRIKYGH